MRRNNNKKRTIYGVLLIVVAILVVGYAVLSTPLNIFGGLSIVGGNSWSVKWSNVSIDPESTATATLEPSLENNNTKVNFVINLTTPGDYYEFYVDATNNGSINAMIDNISYNIYDEEDNEVYPPYIIYNVSYADGTELNNYHLLESNSSATYKVRIQFDSDVSPDDLPSGTETYRFEFSVTYVQADDNAIVPGSNKYMIVLGDDDGVNTSTMESLFGDDYSIIYSNTVSSNDTMLDSTVQSDIENLVDQFGAENIALVIGSTNVNYARIIAQTVTTGDPTNSGPLTDVELNLPVYHVFDPLLESHCNYDVYEDEISSLASGSNATDLVEAVQTIRDQYSVSHSL